MSDEMDSAPAQHKDSARTSPAPTGDEKVVRLLEEFDDTFGSLMRTARLHQEAVKDGVKREAINRLAKDALGATEIWNVTVKLRGRPAVWQASLLVQKVSRLEKLLSQPWLAEGLNEALDEASAFGLLARVYAQALASLASWLSPPEIGEKDWSPFLLSWEVARDQVKAALQRWAEAVAGRDGYPEPLRERLRGALSQTFPGLPAVLDRFDPAVLDRFLEAILEHVQSLTRQEDRHGELSAFVDGAAADFWADMVTHCRTKQNGVKRIGKVGVEVFPYLFQTVSKQRPEVLGVLTRVVQVFELHEPEGHFRAELQPVLEDAGKHVKTWETWRDHFPFDKNLRRAHREGLRAAVTGEFRKAPTRYVLEGSSIHDRPDIQAHLKSKSGRHALPCTLEDLSQDLTGFRFTVPARCVLLSKEDWVAGFLIGDDILPSRDCVLHVPFDLPETQGGGLCWATLPFTPVWGRLEGGVDRVGAKVNGEGQLHHLPALCSYLTNRFRFPFRLAPGLL